MKDANKDTPSFITDFANASAIPLLVDVLDAIIKSTFSDISLYSKKA